MRLWAIHLPVALAALIGCKEVQTPSFTQGAKLGGQDVSAETLNHGAEAYMLYCRACHGDSGAGDGPASYALRPPPRDFRLATYKFAGVVDGLPHDADLARIIRGGLNGTAMLPWDIPEAQMAPLIAYIKTFSPEGEGWRDPDATIGEQVVPPADPWANKDEAVARGKAIYHGFATCQSCHPSYASPEEITTFSQALITEGLRKGAAITEFRPDMYNPEAKTSSTYKAGGRDHKLLPPDFLVNRVRSLSSTRSGKEAEDLFRIIGAGIPGTAMPAWKGALADKEIWAMAHYVESLVRLKGSKEGRELKTKLASTTPSAPQGATPQ
jgi:mono/diheme cytochrome c family protein